MLMETFCTQAGECASQSPLFWTYFLRDEYFCRFAEHWFFHSPLLLPFSVFCDRCGLSHSFSTSYYIFFLLHYAFILAFSSIKQSGYSQSVFAAYNLIIIPLLMIRITRYCLFFSENCHHKKGYPFRNILSPSVASLFPVALLFPVGSGERLCQYRK